MNMTYTITRGEEQQAVTVSGGDQGNYTVSVGDETLEINAVALGGSEYHLMHEGRSLNLLLQGDVPDMVVHLEDDQVPIHMLDERTAARMAATGGAGAAGATGAIQAPMPGKVVKTLVKEGDEVTAGQGIIVVEAMKMENELRAPADGTVKSVLVNEGQNVDAGQDLVIIE